MTQIMLNFEGLKGKVYLPEDRIEGILALVRSFAKVGHYISAHFYFRAAMLQLVEYAQLCMRLIQWYLR